MLELDILRQDAFWDAFFLMADRILHVYGTDSSSKINNAYTRLCAGIINSSDTLNDLKYKWENERKKSLFFYERNANIGSKIL